MGLDMYARVTKHQPASAVDFDPPEATEIHYWRKHPNLHGWMEALYRQKGGIDESFNCVNLQLTDDDLDRLQADIQAKALPSTAGFFFGQSDGSEAEDDVKFVAKAREALAAGLTIYYSSWW